MFSENSGRSYKSDISKGICKINKRSKVKVELIDDLWSQNNNLEGKLKEMKKNLEENELEMVTLKAKVKGNQFQVNFKII